MVSNRQLFFDLVGQTAPGASGLEIECADGIYMYTPEGDRYTDLVSGVSVSSLGHGHPAVVSAIKAQVDKHMHLMVYGEFTQSPQVHYAKWLTDHLPNGLDNVYFVNSGSEAIEGAMKLAKRFTGGREIVAFHSAYHGGTHGALSIIGDPSFQSGYEPLVPGIHHIAFNDPSELNRITRHTAAVIVEPIQAEAGIILPKDGYLKKLRERCNETDTLLIFDEIQTGMGRTGRLFAFEHFEVIPDILCLAKSFGGGMPLGAFVSSKEIMQTLTHNPSLGHITTFGGHPVSCSAGLAAQQFIEENDLIGQGAEMGKLFMDLLQHPLIREIRGEGLFMAVELYPQISPERIMDALFQEKLIVDQFLFCHSAFRIAPPLIISREQVQEIAEAVLRAIEVSNV